MSKVLILGGGFAGLEAAIFLNKEGINDITLVSNRDYFYIYPTSIWVPTKEIEFSDICIDLKELASIHNFKFICDEVVEIKAQDKKVICKENELDFEYLVVAIGAGKMNHNGSENFLSICSEPEESIKIREKIDELVKKGSGKIAMGFGGNPKDSTSVRGGPAFEVLFNVHNYLKKLGIRDKFELTFFAPMEKPGARLGDQALKMMDIFFSKLNINKHFGKKIKTFEKDGIIFEDDSKLESDFTMFIPAGDGHNVFSKSDLPLSEAGFVKINDYCEVEGLENVYAIGDSAFIEGPDWRAKQGHIAEVMARNTAFNIAQKERKLDEKKGYKEHLNILCVMDSGDGAAFVYRDNKGGKMIPMPVIGHWLKKGWGWYCRNSKLNKIPRIPGM